MSSRSAKHRKSKRATPRQPASARHRKPSPISNALQNHPGKTAAAVTGAVIIAAAAPIATHDGTLSGETKTPSPVHDGGTSGSPAASAHASASRSAHRHTPAPSPAATSPASRTHRRSVHHHHHTVAPAVYQNPLRDIAGLIPERIDQGVDFGGAGPIYALGDAVVTNATAANYGWPDGGWITYQLTDGPAKGLMVFVAEDVRPTVAAGAHVTSGTAASAALARSRPTSG